MGKIEIIEEWAVCQDCLQYIVNDDTSGLSYHLSEVEVEEKIADMQRGLNGLEEGQHPALGGEDLGFSSSSCDCCGDHLAGDRYRINILGKVEDPKDRERYIADCIAAVPPEEWTAKIIEIAEEMGVQGILALPNVMGIVQEELINHVHDDFSSQFNEQYEEEQS